MLYKDLLNMLQTKFGYFNTLRVTSIPGMNDEIEVTLTLRRNYIEHYLRIGVFRDGENGRYTIDLNMRDNRVSKNLVTLSLLDVFKPMIEREVKSLLELFKEDYGYEEPSPDSNEIFDLNLLVMLSESTLSDKGYILTFDLTNEVGIFNLTLLDDSRGSKDIYGLIRPSTTATPTTPTTYLLLNEGENPKHQTN